MNPLQNIFPTIVLLSYTKDPKTGQLRILEENHYYPFGLKHEVYTPPTSKGLIADRDVPGQTQVSIIRETEYMYKYNGKEWQDELDLNWYDFHARNYACPVAKLYGNPAIGRWMNPDPMAEKFMSVSPYNYALNNPVVFVDPDGMEVNTGYNRTADESSSLFKLEYANLDGLTGEDSMSSTFDKEQSNSKSEMDGATEINNAEGSTNSWVEQSTKEVFEKGEFGFYGGNDGEECCRWLYEWGMKVFSSPIEGVQVVTIILVGSTAGTISTGIKEGRFDHLNIGGDTLPIFKFHDGKWQIVRYKPKEMSLSQKMDNFVKPAIGTMILPLNLVDSTIGSLGTKIGIKETTSYFLDNVEEK